jgi:hypothetical protein
MSKTSLRFRHGIGEQALVGVPHLLRRAPSRLFQTCSVNKQPEVCKTESPDGHAPYKRFAVSADGQQFLMAQPGGGGPAWLS